ncbi:hypothetical protein C8Q76DRAFT_690252 [Earliella scabrosa]|nr:hypothetical protein C8Q76DRAFT_690252 [Earliella scabrosa]
MDKPVLVVAVGHLAELQVAANSKTPLPTTTIKIELLRAFDVEKLRDLHEVCGKPFDNTEPLLLTAVRTEYGHTGQRWFWIQLPALALLEPEYIAVVQVLYNFEVLNTTCLLLLDITATKTFKLSQSVMFRLLKLPKSDMCQY